MNQQNYLSQVLTGSWAIAITMLISNYPSLPTNQRQLDSLTNPNQNLLKLDLKNSLDYKQNSQSAKITSAQAERIIAGSSRQVILAMKNRDMSKLASLVHPAKGVRFSPYAYVNTDKDKVFKSNQVRNLLKSPIKYNWGAYDGSGEPIELSFKDYFNKFVYDKDFANTKQIAYNRVIQTGNSINNATQIYPNSIIVEYHVHGSEAQYSGLDWKSLRLVFQQQGNRWYLVGIIHDQWTT